MRARALRAAQMARSPLRRFVHWPFRACAPGKGSGAGGGGAGALSVGETKFARIQEGVRTAVRASIRLS
eukprot:4395249-Prymnesium_polylepis.1